MNVRDFGAVGDGQRDDTPAFVAALKAAGQSGGNVVRVPRGNYLLQGTLDEPENVVIEGYFRAPPATTAFGAGTLRGSTGDCSLASASISAARPTCFSGPSGAVGRGTWARSPAQGIAFVIGRMDWEYLTNCFCIGYQIGFQFVNTKAGAPNAVLTQGGSDLGPTAVRVGSHLFLLDLLRGQEPSVPKLCPTWDKVS